MKNVFTKKWFEAATVRAIKTMAQTVIGVVGASTMVIEKLTNAIVSMGGNV